MNPDRNKTKAQLVLELEEARARIRELEAGQNHRLVRESGSVADLSGLLDWMPVMVLAVDQEGMVQVWNRECERVTGYPPGLVAGRGLSLDMLLPRLTAAGGLEAWLTGPAVVNRQVDLHRADGELRRVKFSSLPHGGPGGLTWLVGVDVTTSHLALTRLRETKEMLDAVVEAAPVPIVALDLHGRVKGVWNRAAEQTFGWSRDEVQGQPLPYLDAEESAANARLRERVLKGEAFRDLEVRRTTRGGDRLDFSLYTEVLRDHRRRPTGYLAVLVDITERKRSEEALRRAEEKYRTIFANAPVGICRVSLAGDLLEANQAYAAMFGWDSPDDMIAGVDDVAAQLYADPGRRREILEALEASGGFQAFEAVLRRKDGVRFISRANLHLVRDARGRPLHVEGILEDVTSRREAEDKYRLIFDNAPLGIFQTTVQGRFMEINDALVRMLGYRSRAEAMETVVDFEEQLYAEPGRRREILEILRRRQGLSRFQVRFLRKDGSVMDCNMHIALVRGEDGRELFLEGLIEDITERLQARAEAREKEAQLIQADKMISLGVLTAGVAHEINNPNNFIMLNAPLLGECWESARPVLDRYAREHGDFTMAGVAYSEMREDIGELISGIMEGSERIKRIVADMKGFARQDSRDLAEEVDMARVVEAAVGLVDNTIKKATHNFVLEVEAGLPLVVGNFQRLEQVAVNLVLNAAQALEDMDQEIRVRLTAAPGGLELLVSDQGRGMDADEARRILEPFYTTRRGQGGTGLGLSITDAIVGAHGGKLLFESAPGKGTTARLFLPAAV
jgi:PAS domain S-box-containing protein